eukprot:314478-Amphidinium_carterae.1
MRLASYQYACLPPCKAAAGVAAASSSAEPVSASTVAIRRESRHAQAKNTLTSESSWDGTSLSFVSTLGSESMPSVLANAIWPLSNCHERQTETQDYGHQTCKRAVDQNLKKHEVSSQERVMTSHDNQPNSLLQITNSCILLQSEIAPLAAKEWGRSSPHQQAMAKEISAAKAFGGYLRRYEH